MDGLRWLLLLFGLAVVAGVYLYSRKEREKPEPSAPTPERGEPNLENVRQPPTMGDEPAAAVEPEPKEQRIVTMRIVASADGAFSGEELILSLRGIGMRHGKFGIFHQYEGNDENAVVFSAASLIEPGSFDLENIQAQQVPGISLFMVLPSVIGGPAAFDLMMAAGRALSQSLKAELLDESGSTLSIQREHFLREEIIQFEHGIDVT
jgi:cell division protein ZipA